MNLHRCWPALTCLMMSNVHAAEAHDSSATLSAQGDENDNRQWLGRIVLPLGEQAWVQGSFGETDLAATETGDLEVVGAAFGFAAGATDAAIEYVQRKSDVQFEQQDWAATVTWHGSRGALGADAFLRSASDPQQSADGHGFGVHADFLVTPQARLFAGAMHYEYEFSVAPLAPVNPGPLGSLLGTNVVPSATWRDQAFIDRSYRVGASYRLRRAALSAQCFRDRIANADRIVNTVQLQAEFLVTGQLAVSPLVGRSSGGGLGQAGYAGLSVSFNW